MATGTLGYCADGGGDAGLCTSRNVLHKVCTAQAALRRLVKFEEIRNLMLPEVTLLISAPCAYFEYWDLARVGGRSR